MAQQGGGDDGQEKTLDPTPQRLEEARRKGDVPRSSDANQAAAYVAFLVVLLVAAEGVGLGVAEPLSAFLSSPHLMADALGGPGGQELAARLVWDVAVGVAPLLLAPLAAVVVSLIAQRAVVASMEKLEPKISRIDPIANAGQKFGPTGLVEFLKSLVKMFAVAIILGVIFFAHHDGVIGLMALDARGMADMLLDEAILLIAGATAISIVIASVDVIWQRYDHARKLKMSHQDMKDEAKQTEGDPFMKQTRQRRAREIAMNQMLNDVQKADVVVVNPTHYAVALEWARTPGSAPVCVAKGVDEIAKRIREKAVEHHVPIHSDPATARALYATVDLGQEIRPEHYQAVAAAIRFAEALRRQMAKAKSKAGGAGS